MSLLPTPEDKAYSRGHREASEYHQVLLDSMKVRNRRLVSQVEELSRQLTDKCDELKAATVEVEQKDTALRSIYMHDTTGETPYETVGKLSRIAFEAVSAADTQEIVGGASATLGAAHKDYDDG